MYNYSYCKHIKTVIYKLLFAFSQKKRGIFFPKWFAFKQSHTCSACSTPAVLQTRLQCFKHACSALNTLAVFESTICVYIFCSGSILKDVKVNMRAAIIYCYGCGLRRPRLLTPPSLHSFLNCLWRPKSARALDWGWPKQWEGQK